MDQRSVQHGTFVLEREFAFAPARVRRQRGTGSLLDALEKSLGGAS
jgi:hypothetical protein